MYIFHLCVCTRTHARARDDSKMLILSGPCFSAAVLGSQQIEGSAETSHKPPASHVYPPHHLYPTSEWDTYETDEPTRTHRHHPRSTVYGLCFVLSKKHNGYAHPYDVQIDYPPNFLCPDHLFPSPSTLGDCSPFHYRYSFTFSRMSCRWDW